MILECQSGFAMETRLTLSCGHRALYSSVIGLCVKPSTTSEYRVLELSDRIFGLGPIQDLCLGPGCVSTFPLETISYSCSLCKQFSSCRFQVFWKISLDSYSRLDSKRTIRSSCSIIATKRAFQCL